MRGVGGDQEDRCSTSSCSVSMGSAAGGDDDNDDEESHQVSSSDAG